MLVSERTSNKSVRVVLRVSPSVATAAIVAAQRRRIKLQNWFDKVVVDACAKESPDNRPGTLTDDLTIQLFAQVASHQPGVFTGRWKLLFDRVMLDETLWDYPECTLAAIEEDPDTMAILNVERLRTQWPQLMAATFAL